MSTRRPTDTPFLTDDEAYGLYNFHRPDWRRRLYELLVSNGKNRPPIFILLGEKSFGRQYFLKAAAFNASKAGWPTHYIQLDLDGYEPERSSLEKFAIHQVQKRVLRDSALSTVLRRLSARLSVKLFSLFEAASLSLSLQLQHADESEDKLPSSNLPAEELLHKTIEQATTKSQLILHLIDQPLLHSPLWPWLVDPNVA